VLRALDVASSLAVTVGRLGAGVSVGPLGRRPEQPLELYEFEGCPYCRKVREALTALDLEAWIRPCPRGGHRFRDELERRTGRQLFPYLIDPNTGKEMFESDEIVRYLFAEYGDGHVPAVLGAGALTDLSSGLAGLHRSLLGLGVRAQPSRLPARPLELWSFEGSPFCRIVREKLCSLELPYLLHNVGKQSPSREAFVERSGKMMVPWLLDPNTGAALFESADIVATLDRSYRANT